MSPGKESLSQGVCVCAAWDPAALLWRESPSRRQGPGKVFLAALSVRVLEAPGVGETTHSIRSERGSCGKEMDSDSIVPSEEGQNEAHNRRHAREHCFPICGPRNPRGPVRFNLLS